MAATLIVAKNKLVQDLKQAFYDAYMTQFEPNKLPEATKYDGDIKSSLGKKAESFSNTLSKDMAEAIYNFVKEIEITATVTGTIISPSGPCTGVIPPSSFEIL